MTSSSYLKLLKSNRNLRFFWTGHLISEFGSWFSFVAELGLVHLLSGSPFATAALLVARLLPFLLVAPIAGPLCDLHSRKKILISSDLLRALTALGYLIVIGGGPVWLVFACEATITSLTVFFEAAKSAAIPNLVDTKELLRANSLMYSTEFLQFSLGVAIGGAVAAQFGYKLVFICNSLSFVISAALIALVPARFMYAHSGHVTTGLSSAIRDETASMYLEHGVIAARKSGDVVLAEGVYIAGIAGLSRNFISELRAGWKYIWATTFVRAVLLVNIGWASGGGMIILIYDRIGRQFPSTAGSLGDENVAILLAAAGVGLFVGMMVAPRAELYASGSRRAGLLIGWTLLGQGLCIAIASLMPSILLIALWIFVSRFLIAIEYALQGTFLMRVLPDRYRGRVFTTDRSLEMFTTALSTAAGSCLLFWLSPRTVMIVSALLSASPGFAWLLAMRFRRFQIPANALR